MDQYSAYALGLLVPKPELWRAKHCKPGGVPHQEDLSLLQICEMATGLKPMHVPGFANNNKIPYAFQLMMS